MFKFKKRKPQQYDTTVYFTDGTHVYARGSIEYDIGHLDIVREDGACTMIPSEHIKYVQTYPVKE